MQEYIHTLSRNYENVIKELIQVKKNFAAQDQLITNLLQQVAQSDPGSLVSSLSMLLYQFLVFQLNSFSQLLS